MELYLYFLIYYFRDVQMSSLLSLFADVRIFQSKGLRRSGHEGRVKVR
jgi:hypothetical protein